MISKELLILDLWDSMMALEDPRGLFKEMP